MFLDQINANGCERAMCRWIGFDAILTQAKDHLYRALSDRGSVDRRQHRLDSQMSQSCELLVHTMHVLTVTHRSLPAPAKLSYVRILNEGKVNPLINHPHVSSTYLISRGDVLFLCNCPYIPFSPASVCMDYAHNTLKIHTT